MQNKCQRSKWQPRVAVIIAGLFLTACAGSRVNLYFNKLKYPASMSSSLYAKSGKIVAVGKGLRVVGKLELKKQYWNILWTLVPLTDAEWVDREINKAIKKNKGRGVVNLEFESKRCRINGFPIIGGMPFWPGCLMLTVRGDIVR